MVDDFLVEQTGQHRNVSGGIQQLEQARQDAQQVERHGGRPDAPGDRGDLRGRDVVVHDELPDPGQIEPHDQRHERLLFGRVGHVRDHGKIDRRQQEALLVIDELLIANDDFLAALQDDRHLGLVEK
ncbi:hypothetical protein D3C87_1480760 [compost metagenome]